MRAFCDELALVLERDRLLAVAAEADVYRRTDQVRRSLLGAVSHELRSPLSAIKASVTDLLAVDVPMDAEYRREALQAVNEETDRLDALIGNLLDMSRIEAGNLKARIQITDLAESIRRCGDQVERMWPGHCVTSAIADDASLVRADPVLLERVLTNLLDNAAKASATGSTEMEVRRENEQVTVRVIDHGPGVPAQEREQVFQPFHRLDDHNPHLGRGLGLAICKGFLGAMGGEIWIEETSGGGATFAITLPAAPVRS